MQNLTAAQQPMPAPQRLTIQGAKRAALTRRAWHDAIRKKGDMWQGYLCGQWHDIAHDADLTVSDWHGHSLQVSNRGALVYRLYAVIEH